MDEVQITQELKALGKKIDDASRGTSAQITDLKGEVSSLSHVIRGNGTPGLVTRVSLLEDSYDNRVTKDLELLRGSYHSLLWWIIGLLVAVCGSLVVAVAALFLQVVRNGVGV